MNNAPGTVLYVPKKPNVIRNEYVVPIDVDGTLIIHGNQTKLRKNKKHVKVKDRLSDSDILVLPHNPNIRLLKEEKSRGAHIIVWSRGGFQWAENVIKALDLEKYVDTIVSKPLAYIDDLDVSEWLKYRVYLEPDTHYKK